MTTEYSARLTGYALPVRGVASPVAPESEAAAKVEFHITMRDYTRHAAIVSDLYRFDRRALESICTMVQLALKDAFEEGRLTAQAEMRRALGVDQ